MKTLSHNARVSQQPALAHMGITGIPHKRLYKPRPEFLAEKASARAVGAAAPDLPHLLYRNHRITPFRWSEGVAWHVRQCTGFNDCEETMYRSAAAAMDVVDAKLARHSSKELCRLRLRGQAWAA